MVGNAKGYTSVMLLLKRRVRKEGCASRFEPISASCRQSLTRTREIMSAIERLAAELAETHDAGVIWANQFDNTANMRGHYRSTGPEIGQTEAGSTASPAPSVPAAPLPGLAEHLKEQNPDVKIALPIPTVRPFTPLHAWRAEGRGQFDLGGHRPGRITAISRKLPSTPPTVCPMSRRCRSSTT